MDLLTTKPDTTRNAERTAAAASHGAVAGDVNKIAAALAAMPSSGDLPRYITRTLQEYTHAVIVTFSQYDPAGKTLVPMHVEADSELLKKILTLIGKTIPEIRPPVSAEVYKEIAGVPLGIKYSLHDVTFGAIPKPVSAVIMALTGIDRFYALSYVIEGALLGTSMIALKKDQPDPSREYLESFAYLAAVSLRRAHADQERDKSEERFSAVFHRCPIGIAISRISDGLIVDMNEALLSMCGYSSEESIGVTAEALGIWADIAERRRLIDSLRQERILDFESQFRTKAGGLIDVVLDTVVITLSGEEHILSFVEDITEKKQAEEERKRLEQQLFKSQRLESIGTLAGGIAHDFNNLLAMLLGNAELLRTHLEHDPVLTKYIDRMIEVSSRGASITKQLLLFSRHSDTALEPVSLSDLVDEVQAMLVHFMPKTINVQTRHERPTAVINADAGLIQQVILNLCLNAKDAMNDGGMLTLAERRVDASALREKFGKEISGAYAALSVSDTGVGIDESALTKIFDPFFTTKEKGKGTGLGLSIVHGIVKSHNGYIDVHSVKNEGTTFTLYFPIIASS